MEEEEERPGRELHRGGGGGGPVAGRPAHALPRPRRTAPLLPRPRPYTARPEHAPQHLLGLRQLLRLQPRVYGALPAPPSAVGAGRGGGAPPGLPGGVGAGAGRVQGGALLPLLGRSSVGQCVPILVCFISLDVFNKLSLVFPVLRGRGQEKLTILVEQQINVIS